MTLNYRACGLRFRFRLGPSSIYFSGGVAETASEGDELLVHDCDLDATRFGKAGPEIKRRIRTYSAVTAGAN